MRRMASGLGDLGEVPDRARDLLLLPPGRCLTSLLEGTSLAVPGASRCADRRRARRRCAEAWLQQGVATLSALGGRGESSSPIVLPGAIQRQALADVARAYRAAPPPPDDFAASRAWSLLRGSGSGCAWDGAVAGECATCQRGRLALPVVGAEAVDLVQRGV